MTRFMRTPELASRGWTAAMIAKFLGAPDHLARGLYRNSSKIREYDPERVAKIESSDAFMEHQARSRERSKSATKSADEKRQKLLSEIDSIEIEIRLISMDRLEASSISSYKRLHAEYADEVEFEGKFLERIIVNYIRHNLTRYDEVVFGLHAKTGRDAAHRRLSERIYDAIA